MPDREGNQRGNTASLDKKLSRSLLRQFKRNARNAAERIKHDPWILEYRRVKARSSGPAIRACSRIMSAGVLPHWRCSTHPKRMRAGKGAPRA